jgi:DNA-directed RNA polymerase I, II, and III subunit RPABC2
MADDDYEEFADDLVEDEDQEVEVVADEPHNMLLKFHPETVIDYAETILPSVPLQVVPAGSTATDANHMSPPFLTVYERTKVLGTRANQIAEGARPFIVVPDHMTDPLEIAKLELDQRRLPFIIKRPMPDGTFEYWRLSDLMIL